MVGKYTLDDARELYGIGNWGDGYFDISPSGKLRVLPTRDPALSVDVQQLVDGVVAEGCALPVLLRFPQILATQVGRLTAAFDQAIAEFGYDGLYRPVYPVKVNQQRSVVREILRAGRSHRLGVEVGSKTELLVALALELPEQAFIVCNGFKDDDYIQLALQGRALGRNVVIVIERRAELESVIAQLDQARVRPLIGLRMKLSARGSGKWEKSTGYLSKFGLSTGQLLACVARLEEAGLSDCLKLLHFHIGSQVPDIRRVKGAIKEAAITYAKVRQKCPSVDVLNVGGGLGVDYDGSQTASEASVNYAIQEFANDVIYTIKEVCDSQEVPEPSIVTETGRVMTAYHAMLVVDTLGAIRLSSERPGEHVDSDPEPVAELAFIDQNINAKNFQEYYHDAVEHQEELNSMFKLGLADLDSRARAETLFWSICTKVVRLSKAQKYVPEEFELLERLLAEKTICNFSVFQSVPDSWALDQLFPIVPVSRLDERPEHRTTLVDLTCDSDGEIDRFVDLKDIEESLPVHDVDGDRPYYLAFLLIGAYQEVLGDYHNLFGAVSEAHIVVEPDARPLVNVVKRAQSARDIVQSFGYDGAVLEANFERSVEAARDRGAIDGGQAKTFLKSYAERLDRSSYLQSRPRTNRRALD